MSLIFDINRVFFLLKSIGKPQPIFFILDPNNSLSREVETDATEVL
jgi:hypothetical protein